MATSGVSRASAALPTYSVTQIANYIRYDETGGLLLSNPTSPITVNLSGLTSARRTLARLALATWSDICGLTFQETTGSAKITFVDDDDSGAYCQWTTSGSTITSAVVNVAPSWEDGDSSVDSYTLQTFVHEIGHALGLSHAGPYNGSATYPDDAAYANDSWQMTVMSYFSQEEAGQGSYRFVMTPMMADILAIRGMYGSKVAHAGNSVYGFNSNLSGTTARLYAFSNFVEAPSYTIVDDSGTDTLDASGYSDNQTLDLRGGKLSNIGGLTGNIGIYLTTVIEQAVGGSGSDRIVGNNVGNTLIGNDGNDSLYGLAGNDVLTGGAGNDRLYGSTGNDRLTGSSGNDLMVGGAGNDLLFGGAGADVLTGEAGADNFVFKSINDSNRTAYDRITDFSSADGDRIYLSIIDANTTTRGVNDAFVYIGSSSFSGTAGELRYSSGFLQGDVNGDRRVDLAISVGNSFTYSSSTLIA